jgi:hypothetical protein
LLEIDFETLLVLNFIYETMKKITDAIVRKMVLESVKFGLTDLTYSDAFHEVLERNEFYLRGCDKVSFHHWGQPIYEKMGVLFRFDSLLWGREHGFSGAIWAKGLTMVSSLSEKCNQPNDQYESITFAIASTGIQKIKIYGVWYLVDLELVKNIEILY